MSRGRIVKSGIINATPSLTPLYSSTVSSPSCLQVTDEPTEAPPTIDPTPPEPPTDYPFPPLPENVTDDREIMQY